MNEEMMKEMAEEAGRRGGGGDMAAAMAAQAAQQVTLGILAAVVLWAAAVYFYLFWDRRRDDSKNKDDGQVGLKVIIYSFLLFTLVLGAQGLNDVLQFLLAGAKNTPQIKTGLANLLAGGALFAAAWFMLLPRTNAKDYPQTERYAIGAVALGAGLTTFAAFNGLLTSLFTGANWKLTSSGHFAHLIVWGALAFLALFRLGQMSNWTAPARMSSMPPGFPPAGALVWGTALAVLVSWARSDD